MKQAPGFRICDAPRYQSRLTLAERVQVFDSTGWRPASADELAAMCAGDGDLSVIGIPRRLLKRWWSLAESGDDALAQGFEGFGREIAEYFEYKNWSWPVLALMEVVGSDGRRDRALIPSRPMRFSSGVGTLLACINLDDKNLAIALGPESARIRIILDPGEGLMMPAGGVLWNRSALGNSDLAVILLIGLLD